MIMDTKQIIILLVLTAIVVILFVVAKKMFSGASSKTPKATTVVTTPVVAPAPVPVRATVTATSTTKNSGGFKNLWGFLRGAVSLLFLIAVIAVIVGGLFYGGLWLKTSIDNTLSNSGNTKEIRIVEVVPGKATTIPISPGLYRFECYPPEMTVIEFLNGSGDPLPIRTSRGVVYYLVEGPGTENNINIEQGLLKFVRFQAAENVNRSYSFEFN